MSLTPAPIDVTAAIDVEQTVQVVGGSTIPIVGVTTQYEHVVRISNTSSSPAAVRIAGAPADELYAARLRAAQPGTLAVEFSTEYSPDAQITGATTNIGQVTVREATVSVEARLSPGQTLELRTSLSHTPSSAFTLNQFIRGQSVLAIDERGATVAAPVPVPPLLPPEQRLVQPAAQEIDPIGGPRHFTETGFSVPDDRIWVYYQRRGGQRTFGPPISRPFVLRGIPVQLFERGLLGLGDDGQVRVLNLLEAPFISNETLGDARLPPIDPALLASAPDSTSPDFRDLSHEFVRVNAPELVEGTATRFYTTFLSAVLFRDAFFDGKGDPSLAAALNLEIWGVPTGQPVKVFSAPDEQAPVGVQLRFERGVMWHQVATGRTEALPIGLYLRNLLMGDAATARGVSTLLMGETPAPSPAQSVPVSPLRGLYAPGAPGWIARPGVLPNTTLVMAFEPE